MPSTPGAPRHSSYVKENDVKFGLSVASRVMNSGVVNGLRCRFCVAFGREEKVGTKQKQGSSQMTWVYPFRYDNIENHVLKQHPEKWAEYQNERKTWRYGSRYDECNNFFAKTITTASRNYFQSPEQSGQARPQLVFTIDKDIVESIIGDMMYFCAEDDEDEEVRADNSNFDDGEDDESVSTVLVSSRFCTPAEQAAVVADRRVVVARAKALALSLFEKIDDAPPAADDRSNSDDDEPAAYKYVATVTKPLLFELAVRYTSSGSSFRMTSINMQHTAEVFALPTRALHRNDVSRMMRVACAVNLQKISVLLKDSWAFSIAIDSATHQSTSYLDLRFRVYSRKHRDFFNLHGCALPMHDRHTGQVMYDMLCRFLSVLCPKWQVSMLGVASDGARNMTGRAAGVVTRLQNYMHNNCPLFRIWCGAHQLDLVMEHVMTEVVGNSFLNVMLKFISHLSRQQKLIADMGTTCPRVVNRWLSTYKVTNWFKTYRIDLLRYINEAHPTSAPPRLWWVYLVAMQSFTNYTAITFKYIQESTLLLSEQSSAFDKLIRTFIKDVGVEGPLAHDVLSLRDPETHVSSGSYTVSLAKVRDYVCGLASWVETLVTEAYNDQQNQLLCDIGLAFSVACDRIGNICVLRRQDNSPYVDKDSLPPVLPKQLVNTRPHDFLRMVSKYSVRLDSHDSDVDDDYVDLIADEQKDLIMQYRTDPLLKQAIDSYPDSKGASSFNEAWSVLNQDGFQHLSEFCGGIATLFPGACTVESDFSVLRWEKDASRKQLSDFGLEAILQSKQFLKIQNL